MTLVHFVHFVNFFGKRSSVCDKYDGFLLPSSKKRRGKDVYIMVFHLLQKKVKTYKNQHSCPLFLLFFFGLSVCVEGCT